MWNFSKNSEQPKTLIEVERKRKKYLGADGGVSFHHCWRRRRRRRRQGFKYHISMMIVCAVGTTCETHFFFFFFFVWIPRKLHWFGFWCRWESWNTTWEAEREREKPNPKVLVSWLARLWTQDRVIFLGFDGLQLGWAMCWI